MAIEVSQEAALIIERGQQAWRSLRADETFEKWVMIGRAIEQGRTEIMRALHTNRPNGAQWARFFGAWLAENQFDEIDKGVRSRLQNCLDNLPAIETWRHSLGLGQRLQLNHPNTVWRRWQQARALPEDKSEPAKPGNRKDAEIVRLQEELDAAERRLREFERARDNLTEGCDWTWHDQVEDIAAAMMQAYPDKAKRLGAALQNLAKSSTRKPRSRSAA